MIKLPCELLHLRIATLARQTFQLARCFARLFDQFLLLSLIAGRTVRRSLLHASTLFFECCLLTACEFFKAPFGFTLLLFRLLLLRALHGLVLVLHLVELELEQAGKLLLLSFTTLATTTALIAKRDLDFTKDRIGCE